MAQQQERRNKPNQTENQQNNQKMLQENIYCRVFFWISKLFQIWLYKERGQY